MARKFTITMADGYKVNTLDTFKEHFDINTVIGFFNDGRLLRWLKDRKNCTTEAAQVEKLSRLDRELAKKLYTIFGVKKVTDDIPIWIIEMLNRLKQYTADENLLAQVKQDLLANKACVVFNQAELDEHVKNFDKIYLVSSRFVISLDITDKAYIGIGDKVNVVIDSKGYIVYNARNIKFKDINIEDKNPPDQQHIEKVKSIIDKLSLQYTSDKNLLQQLEKDLLNRISCVAFNQSELDKHVKDFDKIYLVSGYFTIPLDMKNKTYIGIDENVITFIDCKEDVNFSKLNIKFEHIIVKNSDEQTHSKDFAEIRKLIEKGAGRESDYRLRCIQMMKILEKRLEAENNAVMLRNLAGLYAEISLIAYANNCRYKAKEIEKSLELPAIKLYDEGQIAYDGRNYTLAIEKFKKATELGYAPAAYSAAFAYERTGNREEAQRWYALAIKMKENTK